MSVRSWLGTVLAVDRFGNLITNFAVREFSGLLTGKFEAKVGRARVCRCARSYDEGERRGLFFIEGSSGYLEIASRMNSAAQRAGCAAGAKVQLTID